MASIEYNLFRVKFIKPRQMRLFGPEDPTVQDLFLKSLEERPSSESRSGFVWHISNLRLYSPSTGYFAVGRTTSGTIEKFDKASGNFVEERLETSPYTHCVFDASIGFVGIAKKASLAQTAKGVAIQLERLLSRSRIVVQNHVAVEILPIRDPEGFIRSLVNAYKVRRFMATFRGPNPFDADEHFQKPLSVYCASAGAEKGKAQIQGEDLNRDVIKEVARSTAATGNQASARVVRSRGQKPVTVNLEGDPIKRRYDEIGHDPEVILKDLTRIYHQVRSDE